MDGREMQNSNQMRRKALTIFRYFFIPAIIVTVAMILLNLVSSQQLSGGTFDEGTSTKVRVMTKVEKVQLFLIRFCRFAFGCLPCSLLPLFALVELFGYGQSTMELDLQELNGQALLSFCR